MHIAEQRRRTLLKDFHDTWSSIATAKHQHLPLYFLPSLPPNLYFLPWPRLGAVILYPLPPFASLHSLVCFHLSLPLTSIRLQGHRVARLYQPYLFIIPTPFTGFCLKASHLPRLHWFQHFRSDHVGQSSEVFCQLLCFLFVSKHRDTGTSTWKQSEALWKESRAAFCKNLLVTFCGIISSQTAMNGEACVLIEMRKSWEEDFVSFIYFFL